MVTSSTPGWSGQFPSRRWRTRAKGALADCDASGDADDIGWRLQLAAEKGVLHGAETSGGEDVEVQEARQGEVDVCDLVKREGVGEAAQSGDVGVGKGEGRVEAQAAPLGAAEDVVGGGRAGSVHSAGPTASFMGSCHVAGPLETRAFRPEPQADILFSVFR